MSDERSTASRIGDPGLRALYKIENRWQAWLDVEVALARAQAELGIIPADAVEPIARAARLDKMDRARIDEAFARTAHTIVPLVWELSRLVGEPHGGWVHWGATTQNLMKTEFGEVEEPVPPGTVGSSTMPQKRNPKLCQDIIAAAAEIRSIVPLALESMQTEHEADRTTSLMIDSAEARACIITGDMLARLITVLRGLTLKPERMRANLDLSGGLIVAEAVMLELGAKLGRQHAHNIVYDAAQAAAAEDKPFSALLAADPRVSEHLDPKAINKLLDPTAYTGLCSTMARQAAARAREAIARANQKFRSSRA
jgi:adenylosuccinate lyase